MKRHTWLWIVLLLGFSGPLWAYTRSWDESSPSDGSAANLLGQAIRQYKVDVRERLQTCLNIGTPTDTGLPKLSTCWVLIGLDAAKPGSPPDGELYYAYDTNKWYVARSSVWNDSKACQTVGCTLTGTLVFSGAMDHGINFTGSTFAVSPLLLTAANGSSGIANASVAWTGSGDDARTYWDGTDFVFCNVTTGNSTHITPGSATLIIDSGGC